METIQTVKIYKNISKSQRNLKKLAITSVKNDLLKIVWKTRME